MTDLTREEIKEVNDRKLVRVEVPEWGGGFFFGSMLLGERNALIAKWSEMDEDMDISEATDVHLETLIAASCDKDGAPIFTAEDVEMLLAKNATVVERVAREALDFLGLTKKAVEETVGNSDSTPSESSNSG
jgi:hypothetical protein